MEFFLGALEDPSGIRLCLADDSAYLAPEFMRAAILVFLIVIGAGVRPALSIDAKASGEAVDGYAMFGDLTKEGAAKKARNMAEIDFAQNIYRIFVAGMPSGKIAREEYLTNKYGVRVTPIAGCLISDGIEGAMDGYNSTMKRLLNRKFGHDIFKEAEEATRK